jgi:broad specificity phosphatase PhoE
MHTTKGFHRGSLRVALAIAGVAVIAALSWGLGGWWRCGAPTTLLIVRHADRAGTGDALDASGAVRAKDLARVAERAGLSAIYHSDTVRARDTAAPLARALGLVTHERSATDVAGLVAEILRDHRGQRVLVVGHSNTVPQIISAAGGPPSADLEHEEYDELFVLTRCECSRAPAELVRLQYGAASP